MLAGYGLPAPPPESLLGRLDQIDLRLRQLEEQRRSSAEDGCFAGGVRRGTPAPQHHHSKSMPSELQHRHAHLRGTLKDRLNLLESRIRQLSCDLDSGKGSAAAGSSVAAPPRRSADDRAWSESPLMEACRSPAAMYAADKSAPAGSWRAVQILQRGVRQLHRNKPNPTKVKNLKEAKCSCQDEKRKAERNRAGRRWFTFGC